METSRARLVLVFSCIAHTFDHMFMLLYQTAVLGIGDGFGLSYDELLTLALPGFVLFGVGALPAGWLGDRWSAHGMMKLMLIGLGLSAIATGCAQSPWQIAVGLGAIGLFAAIYHPVGIALLVRHAKSRGRTLGINGIFGGVGMASAALVAGILTDLISWRAAFILPGLASVATGFAYMAMIRGPDRIAAAGPARDQVRPRLGKVLAALAALSVAAMCAGLIYQSTSVALPKVFTLRIPGLGDGALGAGTLVTLVYLAGAMGQYFGGSLADRLPLKPLFAVAFLVQVPLLAVAAELGGWWLLPVALVMVTCGLGLQPIADSLLAHHVPPAWHSTAYGARFVASLGVSSLNVPLVALIYRTTGAFDWLFLILAGLAALAVLVTLLLPRDRERVEEAPAPV